MKTDILKSGAVILRDKKLLIVKPRNKDYWISFGGKLEDKENAVEALKRELQEEIGISIVGEPRLIFTSPLETAIGDPDKTIQIFINEVEIDREPIPSREIEKIHWLSREEFEDGNFVLGSVLEKYVVPMLVEEGRM